MESPARTALVELEAVDRGARTRSVDLLPAFLRAAGRRPRVQRRATWLLNRQRFRSVPAAPGREQRDRVETRAFRVTQAGLFEDDDPSKRPVRFLLLRAILLLVAMFAFGPSVSTPIEPVRSWDHYRELLIEDGRTEREADDRIGWLLDSLKTMDRSAGSDRIGLPAPPFAFDAWLNSEPLALEDLRGRVVLVRWWTDTCPFCASSASALRELHRDYEPRGLTLVGVFHPKAGRDDPLDRVRVERVVAQRDFEFPIAVDWDWRNGTLRDWWLTGPDRPATSVTFLLDKHGVIRFIHPGMEYHDASGPANHPMCVDDMARIRTEIERLLAE